MNTLFHYCNTSTFQSIVNSQSVWLSSLSLSNDSMEGKLVSKVVCELAREDELSADAISRLGESIFLLEGIIDGLGFCLSEEGDLLSQWRGYADNGAGVSVGFSKEYLEALSKSKTNMELSGFSLQQVKYTKSEQIVLVRPVYEEVKKLIDQGAYKMLGLRTLLDVRTDDEFEADKKKAEDLQKTLSLTVLKLFGKIFVLKSGAFKEECEWRLISILLKDGKDKALYRAVQDRIIPYRSFQLKELDKNSITHVILGPRNKTPHYVIDGLLNMYGFKNVKISNSKATYVG